jgi:integrase
VFRTAARTEGQPVGQGLHVLRHTCVSVLIQQGATPKDIQAWVGHTSIQETMDTYGHLFPDAKHSLARMLDANVPSGTSSVNLEVVS